VYEHFSILVAKAYYDFLYQRDGASQGPEYNEESYAITEGISVPFSYPGSHKLLMNYVDRQKYTRISFLDVYNGNFEKGFFEDKVVFI
jgi:CHASE2 domain-containing sensor protein